MSSGAFDKVVVHYSEIEDPPRSYYPGSDEAFAHGAAFSNHFNLMRLGVHHERLAPGKRTSWAGTGIAHVFINNTDSDVRLLVVGEASRQRSRVDYPLHPKRNEEIAERHWKDKPQRELGPHDGMPDKPR